ncbi:MAG TPA: MFS transporter [Anaerolineales bacterium]|nr:MFS transporter [Anaerolineales bacterium]
MNTASRRNLFILSFTLLVVMLGYGMVLPVMPFYVEHFGAGGRELGWMMSTYSLMQLICAPMWGVLSDRYGRKSILSIGVLGYAITLFMFGLATSFWMLFLARALSGILSSATMPTAMAYIGDQAPEKERSEGMGQLGAAMGVGIVIGPILGGFLSTDSLSFPFFIGAGLAFIAFLLVIAILPESRVTQPATDKRTHLTREALRQTFLSPVGILLLLIFVMSFGLTSFQGITGLYVIDKFAFDTKQVGAIWMVMGGTLIVVQGVLTGPLTKRFGEAFLIRTGLVGGALGFIAMSLATGYVTTLLALGFFTVALAMIGPTLNAHISRFAGERQGTVMGLNSAATSLGRVIGPLWAGYLYEVNIEFPYLSGAAALVVGLLVSWFGLRSQMEQEEISTQTLAPP